MEDIQGARSNVAALIALGAAIGKPQSNPHSRGRHFVMVPQANGDWKVEYLERPNLPERKSGTVRVDDTKSFIAGVKRYADKERSVMYAALEPAGFVAVLNDYDSKDIVQSAHNGANWRDHRVSYTLLHSKEWDTWAKACMADFTQESLAYFIEDNLPDFVTPTGAKMLEIATNFRVKQGVSFKSGFRPQDGQVQMEYIESNEGNAGVNGKMSIPETFIIDIPVWKGVDAKKHRQEVRLRYRVNGGNLSIKLQGIRVHKTVEKAFTDVLEEITKGVKDVPVIFGSPDQKS